MNRMHFKYVRIQGKELAKNTMYAKGIYRIGDSVAPGVPVMTPLDNPALRLVLKSGNFGEEDFFGRAIKLTGKNL